MTARVAGFRATHPDFSPAMLALAPVFAPLVVVACVSDRVARWWAGWEQ